MHGIQGLSSLASSATRLDPSLLVLDFLHLALMLPVRSLTQLGLTLSVFDHAKMGSSVLLRSPMRSDLCVLVLGMACLDLPLPVLDATQLGFSLFLRSFSWLEPLVLVLDPIRPGFSLSSRSTFRVGSMLLVFGEVFSDSSSSVLDLLHLDFFLFSRALA